jgi:hypothetical protein
LSPLIAAPPQLRLSARAVVVLVVLVVVLMVVVVVVVQRVPAPFELVARGLSLSWCSNAPSLKCKTPSPTAAKQ